MKFKTFRSGSKGQIVIEFLLLLGISFFIIITLLASVFSISESTTKAKTYDDLYDLGMAIQEEFLLAAQLEDGYVREINLPMTLNGKTYNATVGQLGNASQAGKFGSYLVIGYDQNIEIFYEIPTVYGNITLGDNVLRKQNGELILN